MNILVHNCCAMVMEMLYGWEAWVEVELRHDLVSMMHTAARMLM
jgi:hypothetical protein